MAGFSIYTRTRKNGKAVFYARFKKPDGTYTTAISTGCTTKRDASQWCENYLLKKGVPLPGKDLTLSEFADNFFSWNGPWATSKRVEGKRISESHCRDRADIMRRHVLPVFGNVKLSKIDKISIKQFRNDLYIKEYSGSLINKCLYALKTILEDAEDKGLILSVPKIVKAADSPKPKGILSIEEVNRLFSLEWGHETTSQYMGYVGNLLAASTGLRLGELQALQMQDLHLDGGYITIKRSWDNRCNKLNETTKTGRERNIFIPEKVISAIPSLLAVHPFPNTPESFLFFGERKPTEKPAEKAIFVRSLYRAMQEIGISEEKRRARNITFHSWRHFLNSLLINAKIPLQKIQSITGHLTAEMTQHYYHIDDMQDVRQIQENLFSASGNKETGDQKTIIN